MVNMQQLMDLGLATDRADLTRRLERVAADMGFGLFQALWVRGRFNSAACEMVACGNPPEAFQASTVSMDESLRDPVLAQLLAGSGYVTYDHETYLRAQVRDLYDNQAAFGYVRGVAHSMHHSSHEEAFFFGVDGPDRLPVEPAAVLRLQSAVTLVSVHVQAALQRIARPEAAAEACVSLTGQEVRAVRQVAASVYQQRGHLVAVSSSRALRTAARKLGASTATGTVLRAIEGGLIQP